MKKIVASVGLVAIGASGIQTACAQALGSPDTSKPWSVSATLRGFYDDNTATLPNNITIPDGEHRDSLGFEVSPSAALAWSVDQTTITLGAMYSFRHYDHIPINSTGHNDNTFTFNGGLTHAFNEQISARVSDSFVIGQEPDVLRAGNTFSTFQRVSGNNIRNYGTLGLDAQLTPEFGLGFGYDNTLYDYKDRGPGQVPLADGLGTLYLPSTAGALNRIENRAHLEGTYQWMPETKALIGYQFTDINYNADEFIGGFIDPFLGDTRVLSDQRNSREHTGYLGLEHNFSPQFRGAIRAGASYTMYPNDDFVSNTWTPYVNASLRYNYAPLSYVEGGVSYDRNATDVVGAGMNGTTTVDAQSAVVYAAVTHSLTPQIFINVIGQFQNSRYHGGTYDGETEQYYLLGLNLEYRFNQYFAAHVGYNYDRLESNDTLNRTYDRNRVYIGVTASY